MLTNHGGNICATNFFATMSFDITLRILYYSEMFFEFSVRSPLNELQSFIQIFLKMEANEVKLSN